MRRNLSRAGQVFAQQLAHRPHQRLQAVVRPGLGRADGLRDVDSRW